LEETEKEETSVLNEQILKRLQDALKLQVCVLEQLEELQWLLKDVIEDLVLEISGQQPGPGPGAAAAPQKPVESLKGDTETKG
jgi:hypothetical protein